MNEFQLGQPVRYTKPLVRKYVEIPGANGSWAKKWLPKTDYKGDPMGGGTGIIVGRRTLSNGENHYYGYDEPIVYRGRESFTAYLIAFDLRRKPVYVRPEDIQESS